MTHPVKNVYNNQERSRNYIHEQQVNSFLSHCGLSQYYDTLIDEGFDRLDSLLEITETDLIQMQVKRGHRRLLQRAIYNIKGLPTNAPLNIVPIPIHGGVSMDIDTTSNNSNNNSNNNTPHAAYTSVYHKDLYDKSLESLEVLDLLSDTNTIINHHIQNDDTMNTDIHAPTHTNSNTNNQHHQHHHHHHTHHTTCNNTNQNNHTSTSTSTSNDMTVSPSLSPSNEKKSVIGNNNTLDTVSTSSSSNSSSSGQNNHANNNNAHHHLHHLQDYFPSAGTMIHNSHSGMSSTEEEAVTSDNVHRLWKRKYQRHAKPDTNAPIKPPSAYVMFSNDIRSELKKENKSFTDLAKIIGDRWKNISVEEKERYEGIASKAREDFIRKTSEYQKTDLYKRYQKYIKDFKSEHEAAARPVGRPRKRQKGLTYCIDEETTDLDSIATNEVRSLSSEQRQYPYYLLNDDSSQRSTPIATVVTDKQT